jgi:hypothetical protein
MSTHSCVLALHLKEAFARADGGKYGQLLPRLPRYEADECGLCAEGWTLETPFWYYVLKEVEVRNGGEYLGEVGGRMVADVLFGLIDPDPTSYRRAASDWQPTLRSRQAETFTMADLLTFAGVA